MKPTAPRIERWLSDVEARLVPPPRKRLRVIVHELREGESREKAFAEMAARYPQNVAGKTVDDLNWSDDLVGAQEKVVAEHIAAHPEDAGRTVADFDWSVREIVCSPQLNVDDSGFTALSEPISPPSPELTAVSETDLNTVSEMPELNVLPPRDPPSPARSVPWRPAQRRSWITA
jgi:hypothetical protein